MARKKILIVEDEGVVAMEIMSELEALGYAAATYDSGEETLEDIELSMPDLVVMDIRLQGKMDGIETAERIREKHDIPVIFLSAYTDDGTIEKARATAPYGYIVKPFAMKDLQRAIEIALYRHEIEQEKEQLTKELQDALAKVKLLSGLLPICSCCKKIRDDQGSWKQLESYITEHSEAVFSHGICPACAKQYYAELDGMKKPS
jgi:two-component system, response regulator PdtaR